MATRRIRRGDFEAIVELGLTGYRQSGRNAKSFGLYLEALRRAGGDGFVLEEGGEIRGEAEIAPQSELSVAGPHNFLVNLKAAEGDREILGELLRACMKQAMSWGYTFMDRIPKPEEESLYGLLGFTRTIAKQIRLRAEVKKVTGLAKAIEIHDEEYPSDLALLAGEIRPGRLAWEVLREEELCPSRLYQVRLGRIRFLTLLSEEDEEASLSIYGVPASGPGELFDALGAVLTLCSDIGFKQIRTMIWRRYMCSFESADFEVKEEAPLMRMRI